MGAGWLSRFPDSWNAWTWQRLRETMARRTAREELPGSALWLQGGFERTGLSCDAFDAPDRLFA
jgi:hypothetical protein